MLKISTLKLKITTEKGLQSRPREPDSKGFSQHFLRKTCFLPLLKQIFLGLKFCGCEALKAECDKKRFDITSFHSLAYEKICEPQKFNATCIESVAR